MKKKNPFAGFTKFEIGLWIVSVVSVTASFLWTPQKGMLTLTASLVGVTALIFVAKGRVLGQILTVIFAAMYGVISFFYRYYGEVITYLCMSAPIAVCAVISWMRHPYRETSEVAVQTTTKKQLLLLFGATGIVTAAFYFILRALRTPNLIFSTVSVATSFLASALTFLRSPYYGIAYGANDIVLIVLWALAAAENIAYLPMIPCFGMFLINDCYGFINWRKMRKRQTAEQTENTPQATQNAERNS